MPKVYTGDLTKMFDISGKKAMIFGGAGGFGEAIAAGYAANGCSVCISSRSEEKLQAAKAKIEAAAAPGVKVMYIAGDAGDEEFVKKAVEVVTGPEGLGGCDILVNATRVGMKPLDGETLVDPALFRADLVVADTVYNPRETRMIREARAAGCQAAVGGIGMLLWQGVAAFKLFTGKDMPTQEVLEKFLS